MWLMATILDSAEIFQSSQKILLDSSGLECPRNWCDRKGRMYLQKKLWCNEKYLIFMIKKVIQAHDAKL